MISYAPFYETLKARNISQYDLQHMGVSNRLLNSIKHNRSITMDSLNMLCHLLNCDCEEIVRIGRTEEEYEIYRKRFISSYRKDLHKKPLKSDKKLNR